MGCKNNASVICRIYVISSYEMGIKKRLQTDARKYLWSVNMEWAARQVHWGTTFEVREMPSSGMGGKEDKLLRKV